MKVVFGSLSKLLAELKTRNQMEVRAMLLVSHTTDQHGLVWTSRYSLVTAALTPEIFGELRVAHGVHLGHRGPHVPRIGRSAHYPWDRLYARPAPRKF